MIVSTEILKTLADYATAITVNTDQRTDVSNGGSKPSFQICESAKAGTVGEMLTNQQRTLAAAFDYLMRQAATTQHPVQAEGFVRNALRVYTAGVQGLRVAAEVGGLRRGDAASTATPTGNADDQTME